MVHDLLTVAPKTPRARRHEANLARILDAAMGLIADGGLTGLSMTKLADAVTYTPGALYRYFPSKDALLSQLVVRTLTDVRLHGACVLALLPASASPLARVVALGLAYRAFAKAEPHRFGLLAMTMAEPRILLEEQADTEPVALAMIAAMQPLSDALRIAAEAGLLSAVSREGELTERTLCLFALLQGMLQLSKSTRYAPALLDVDRLLARGIRTLLIGWGAHARTVDAAMARVGSLGDLSRVVGGES
ncbi:MAG: TetR/AcrR family transcriptional regulator [Polyangiaceae bacterium]